MASEDTLKEGLTMASEIPLKNGKSMANKSPLRHLYETRVSVQKLRVQFNNRTAALERGVDSVDSETMETYANLEKMAVSMESALNAAAARLLKRYPVWEHWLSHVRGIGPLLSLQMLSILLPPIPTKGPSSWYKAAGLYTEEVEGISRLPRPRKGAGKVTYHTQLRKVLWNVGDSFIKGGNYYRKVYDDDKGRLAMKHQGDLNWPPHRLHAVARWTCVKTFLSDLWECWCEADGIHNRGPYGMVALPDGTKVIRHTLPDGATQDHAFKPAPRWDGGEKI